MKKEWFFGGRVRGGTSSFCTTSEFVEEFGVQLAINGSFFEPFRVGNLLWDYYPHSNDPVDIIGMAI